VVLGLDIMHAAHSTKQLFFIAQAFEALARELACRSAIRQAQLQCESLGLQLGLGFGSSMCPRCRDGFSGAANKDMMLPSGFIARQWSSLSPGKPCAYGGNLPG